jgi:anti-anti-sigma regulatory factor
MAIPFFRRDKNKPEAEAEVRQQAKEEADQADFTAIGTGMPVDHGILVEEVGGSSESAIDEAAMLYASNQADNAETLLKSLLHESDQRAWHMLFDLYRLGQRDADFEKLALEFAMRFECSPPVWKAVAEKNAKDKAVSRHLSLPPKLDAGIQEKMGHVLTSLAKDSTLQLDFSQVVEIDKEGAHSMADMLTKTRKSKLKFQVSGASTIIDLLKSRMQDEPDEQIFWQMLLAVYQMLGKQNEFEDLAIDFAVAFELSPPSWENVQAAKEVAAPAIEIPKDAFTLKGVISEGNQDQIAKLMQYAESHTDVVVDCSAVSRVDYGYVGHFIGQLMQLLGSGKTITLQGQNALINELFRAMGIDQLASLVPAKLV